jgi:PAS domain S-box-containing protein
MNHERTAIPMVALLMLVALLTIQFQSLPSHAADHFNKIVAGVPKDFPPHYSIDQKTGRSVGFAVDTMDEIAGRAGVKKVQYVVYDGWAEVIQAIKEGRVDIIPNIGIIEERQADMGFTSPIETYNIVIFVRSATDDINEIGDLRNRKVAVVAANKGLFIIKEYGKAIPVIFNSLDEGLLSLLSGNTDALVYPEPPVSLVAIKSGLSEKIKKVGKPLLEVKRAIAVAKGKKELFDTLDREVRKFVASPEYMNIYAKWYGAPKPYWDAARLLTAAGIVFAFTLVVFAIWHYLTLMRLNVHLKKSIEEQKKAEEAVRRSEELFKVITSSTPDHLIVQDSELRYSLVINPTLGLTEQEMIGKRDHDLLQKEDADTLTVIKRQVLETGTPVSLEVPLVSSDGGQQFFDGSYVAKHNATGQIDGLIGYFRNVTERKRAENALLAERERLAVTLRSIGDGVITTDANGNITLLNKVAEVMTGWSNEEAMSRPLTEVFNIINEKTREVCENPVAKVLRHGGIILLANHTALIRRDGKEILISDSGAPIRDRESKIIGVVLVFRDVTDQEKAEKAMQNAQKLESIGTLAGGIAHDFNNLLGGIFGHIEMAKLQLSNGRHNDSVRQLDAALSVFERAKALTQQLLTFSKGGAPIIRTQSIQQIVEKSISFALSGSNISPAFTISDKISLCDFDENQMAQVFDNIAINACQAMPLGGKLEVRVSPVAADATPVLLPSKAYLCISIRDYGIGILPNHLPYIFDPFFSTKQQGSGLGLSSAYSIVKRHGGLIDVESEAGKGTTFHIYLPASSEAAASREIDQPRVHCGQGSILVMDDEEFILEVTSLMLKEAGYEVVTVRDGNEAIATARCAAASGRPFTAAILDLTIPGGRGGKETVGELLEVGIGIKVIASSGYSNDPVIASPADFGFSGSLIKPYRRIDLIKALQSIS